MEGRSRTLVTYDSMSPMTQTMRERDDTRASLEELMAENARLREMIDQLETEISLASDRYETTEEN